MPNAALQRPPTSGELLVAVREVARLERRWTIADLTGAPERRTQARQSLEIAWRELERLARLIDGAIAWERFSDPAESLDDEDVIS